MCVGEQLGDLLFAFFGADDVDDLGAGIGELAADVVGDALSIGDAEEEDAAGGELEEIGRHWINHGGTEDTKRGFLNRESRESSRIRECVMKCQAGRQQSMIPIFIRADSRDSRLFLPVLLCAFV